MTHEDWKQQEIADLETEKEDLTENEEIKDVWRKAFFDPEKNWRLNPALEERIRREGFTITFSELDPSKAAREKEFLTFKRLLVTGACEYLKRHGQTRNTANILSVLKSNKEFENAFAFQTLSKWLWDDSNFRDIVEKYEIDHKHIFVEKRYEDAIRTWWRENPRESSLSANDIAKKFGWGSDSSVHRILDKYPRLKQLMQKRPEDL